MYKNSIHTHIYIYTYMRTYMYLYIFLRVPWPTYMLDHCFLSEAGKTCMGRLDQERIRVQREAGMEVFRFMPAKTLIHVLSLSFAPYDTCALQT